MPRIDCRYHTAKIKGWGLFRYKYKYINNYFDIPIEDWETNWGRDGSKIQSGKFPVYAYILQNALQEAADAGTPVMDGDQYMQLADKYQVDYSAYLN